MVSRENKEFAKSIDLCKKIISEYPKSNYYAPAIYMIADISYNNLKNYVEAKDYFNQFEKLNLENELTPIAIYISGFIYEYHLNKSDSAIIKYEKFIQQYPNHKYSEIVQTELQILKNETGN